MAESRHAAAYSADLRGTGFDGKGEGTAPGSGAPAALKKGSNRIALQGEGKVIDLQLVVDYP
jgi:hypothetical protein